MKSRWIDYKNRRIFFADYTDFGNDSEGLRAEVAEAVDTIAREPSKSVLVLSDFSGTVETMKNLDVVRQLVKRSNAAVIKRALLGISGIRSIFMTTFSNVTGGVKMEAFDNREAAMDWLIKS